LNNQFTLADLLRQAVYSRLAGYEGLNDAERLPGEAYDARVRGPNRKFRLTGILGSNAFAHLSNLKVESMGRKYF
jgi:hypothetical protein